MEQRQTDSRLVIGMSGASGVIYGIRALEMLQDLPVETHLVMSKAAALTITYETDRTVESVKALADKVYSFNDIAAAISSGSFKTRGMLVAPCSIKTLGEITSGVTSSLLSRAADVVLKEKRRLVLMVRETPLHVGHLRNMTLAAEMGAVIAPPVPAFYANPTSLDEMINQTVGRALDQFEIDAPGTKRWGEDLG